MYSPMIGFELMKTKIKTTVIKQNETTSQSCNLGLGPSFSLFRFINMMVNKNKIIIAQSRRYGQWREIESSTGDNDRYENR
jgi:hypothetical protein